MHHFAASAEKASPGDPCHVPEMLGAALPPSAFV